MVNTNKLAKKYMDPDIKVEVGYTPKSAVSPFKTKGPGSEAPGYKASEHESLDAKSVFDNQSSFKNKLSGAFSRRHASI